jgi:hypothetical protein
LKDLVLFGHNGFAQRMALEDEGTNPEEDMVVCELHKHKK